MLGIPPVGSRGPVAQPLSTPASPAPSGRTPAAVDGLETGLRNSRTAFRTEARIERAGLGEHVRGVFRRFASPVGGAVLGMSLLLSGSALADQMVSPGSPAAVQQSVETLAASQERGERAVATTAEFTVRRGDTLNKIADAYGVNVDALLALNPDIRNPNRLRIGQVLHVPAAQDAQVHIVRRGDTMYSIARQHGLDYDALRALNRQIRFPNLIAPGDRILIRPEVRPDGPASPPREPAPPPTTTEPQPVPVPRREDGDSVRGGRNGEPGLERRDPSTLPTLRPGRADADAVGIAQSALIRLGYLEAGSADGKLGTGTRTATAAFQYEHGLGVDGIIGPQTWKVLLDPSTAPATADRTRTYRPGDRFAPRSAALRALFRSAAPLAGVPASWAAKDSLHELVERESNGRIGLPNYTYGARRNSFSGQVAVHNELRAGRIRAASSATGLGQLLLSNVDVHYPSARAGIGVPVEEAAGMMSYIKERYGNPDNALRLYGKLHEGY